MRERERKAERRKKPRRGDEHTRGARASAYLPFYAQWRRLFISRSPHSRPVSTSTPYGVQAPHRAPTSTAVIVSASSPASSSSSSRGDSARFAEERRSKIDHPLLYRADLIRGRHYMWECQYLQRMGASFNHFHMNF